MLCKLNKLLISRAIDNGEDPGRRLARHMEHCENCAAYYESCRTIDVRLKQSTEDSQSDLSLLNKRIMGALPNRSETRTHTDISFIDFIKSFASVPRLATVGVCIIIIASVSLHVHESREIKQYEQVQEVFAYIDGLKETITGSGDNENVPLLEQLAQGPYAREMNNLTADVTNTAAFLLSCVDVGVPAEIGNASSL